MAYRLKTIQYKGSPSRILVQNENGPCPLIAVANALLLKASIKLPTNCVGAGVITIDELINVLAEKVLTNAAKSKDHQFHVQEVLQVFPSLQFGMDLNPKFTKGPAGVEYTQQLNAFDLLHVEMVHGWLVDPNDPEESALIGNQTYNQLVNLVIKGNEAKTELDQLHTKQLSELDKREKHHELSTTATNGSLVHSFLERSASQLTQYGLQILHDHVKEGEMYVFFRNNHFNTLTKHKGSLYLLVTDLGFATLSDVVWEKLDVIDGDTEYMNASFQRPSSSAIMQQQQQGPTQAATGEQLLANNAQSQVDYHLALQLSRETSDRGMGAGGGVVAAQKPPPSVAAKAPTNVLHHPQYNFAAQSQKTEETKAPVSTKNPPPPGVTRITKVPQPPVSSSVASQSGNLGVGGGGAADIQAAMQASLWEYQREMTERQFGLPAAQRQQPQSPSLNKKPAATANAMQHSVAVAIPASGLMESPVIQEDDRTMARRLYENEDASRRLAMQLQEEEQRHARARSHSNPSGSRQGVRPTATAAAGAGMRGGGDSKGKGENGQCVIS